MNKYAVQLRYEFPPGSEPTREQVERIARQWVATGKTPDGVRLKPVYWGKKSPRNLRAWLGKNNFYFGCPGIVKRYADPAITMCDYDHGRPPTMPDIWRVAARLDIKPVWVEYDRTRRGWHLTIKWNRKFKPAETIALQSILGSDPGRETFNLLRVLSGKAERNRRWNLLFERKLA